MLLRASTSESLFLSGPKGQAACSRGRSEAAKPQAKPPDGRSQDNAAPAGAAGGAAGGQASFLPPPSGRRPVNRRSGGCASLAPGYAPRAPLGRKRLSMDCRWIGAGYSLQKTVPCRALSSPGHPPAPSLWDVNGKTNPAQIIPVSVNWAILLRRLGRPSARPVCNLRPARFGEATPKAFRRVMRASSLRRRYAPKRPEPETKILRIQLFSPGSRPPESWAFPGSDGVASRRAGHHTNFSKLPMRAPLMAGCARRIGKGFRPGYILSCLMW